MSALPVFYAGVCMTLAFERSRSLYAANGIVACFAATYRRSGGRVEGHANALAIDVDRRQRGSNRPPSVAHTGRQRGSARPPRAAHTGSYVALSNPCQPLPCPDRLEHLSSPPFVAMGTLISRRQGPPATGPAPPAAESWPYSPRPFPRFSANAARRARAIPGCTFQRRRQEFLQLRSPRIDPPQW